MFSIRFLPDFTLCTTKKNHPDYGFFLNYNKGIFYYSLLNNSNVLIKYDTFLINAVYGQVISKRASDLREMLMWSFLLEQLSVTSMCEDGSPPKLHAQSEKWFYKQMNK